MMIDQKLNLKLNGIASIIKKSNYPFIKLKYLISDNDGGNWGNEVFNDEEGIYVLRSTEINKDGTWNLNNPFKRDFDDDEIIKYKLLKNDIILTKSSGSPEHIGKSALVTKEIENLPCCYSNFIQRIRFIDSHPKLYHYILNSHLVRQQYKFLTQSTTGLGNLSAKTLNDVLLPMIPINQQEYVFQKIDKKIKKIDKFIKILEQSIKITIESIISNMHEGLESKKKLKNYNEWFKNIPESWTIVPMRDFFKVIVKKNNPNERLLSVTQDRGIIFRDEQKNRVMEPDGDLSLYKLTEPDNFVISLRSSEGGFELSKVKGIVSNAYTVLEPKYQIDNIYYKYLFKSNNFIVELNKYISGIRDGKNINFQDIKNIKIPIKILNKNEINSNKTLKKHVKKDKKINEQKDLIDKLNDYKKSLIFENIIN